jgi:hypothetical protein
MLTLKELAERWNKTENDILRMAIDGEVKLSGWWRGYANVCQICDGEEICDIERSSFNYSEWFNDQFNIPRDTVRELLATPFVNLQYFEHNGAAYYFSTDKNRGGHWDDCREYLPFKLTKENIVISRKDIEVAEIKNPVFVPGAVVLQDKITPSEKKSLAKLIYAMAVDAYGYDPEDKKSPIPKEIVEIIATTDLSISEDTVRKWLKEGAKLRDKMI